MPRARTPPHTQPDECTVADGPSEQSVFVMLNGEESELRFVDVTNIKVSTSGGLESRRRLCGAKATAARGSL